MSTDWSAAPNFLGYDEYGYRVVELGSLRYALTPCCGASGKGADCNSGVVCRSCYREVDAYFGGPAEPVKS